MLTLTQSKFTVNVFSQLSKDLFLKSQKLLLNYLVTLFTNITRYKQILCNTKIRHFHLLLKINFFLLFSGSYCFGERLYSKTMVLRYLAIRNTSALFPIHRRRRADKKIRHFIRIYSKWNKTANLGIKSGLARKQAL